MVVTTTRSTTWLLDRLIADYPKITFRRGPDFSWSAGDHVLSYVHGHALFEAFLLHELAHYLLGHHDYQRDIDLLTLERQAWSEAGRLGAVYMVAVDNEVAEQNLDSYRQWLDSRSACPDCKATGYQTAKTTYQCPACRRHWRVNEARTCALRRYRL